MIRLWRRWPQGPPIEFTDPRVAAVRDPAARLVADTMLGLVRDLTARVAAVENREREITARLAEVRYVEGSAFAADERMAREIVRETRGDGDVDKG